MTQMGLEYQKLMETARHNVEDEGIRKTGNVIGQQDADTRKFTASFEPQKVAISQQDADTRKYVASFKPTEVAASTMQAKASASQADTAAGKLALDSRYRERETVAKEGDTAAKIAQASTAQEKVDNEYFINLLGKSPSFNAALQAGRELGIDDRATISAYLADLMVKLGPSAFIGMVK